MEINPDLVFAVPESCLHFALKVYDNNSTDEETRIEAEGVIIDYVLYEFVKKGKIELDEDDINLRFHELVVDFAMQNLSDKGLVDVSFDDTETKYSVNAKGREYFNKIADQLQIAKCKDEDEECGQEAKF